MRLLGGMVMISFELLIQKAIVKKINDLGYIISENPLKAKLPCIVFGDFSEQDRGIKTHRGNKVTVVLDMWGEVNKPSIQVKELKNRILQELTETEYNIDGCSIDTVVCTQSTTIKEMEGENDFLYHGVLHIDYLIKEEAFKNG